MLVNVHVVQRRARAVVFPKGNALIPSLLKLKTMEGADGNPLRIIPRIAAGDYMTFGICLLQDENGVDVDVLAKKHAHDGPEGIERLQLRH